MMSPINLMWNRIDRAQKGGHPLHKDSLTGTDQKLNRPSTKHTEPSSTLSIWGIGKVRKAISAAFCVGFFVGTPMFAQIRPGQAPSGPAAPSPLGSSSLSTTLNNTNSAINNVGSSTSTLYPTSNPSQLPTIPGLPGTSAGSKTPAISAPTSTVGNTPSSWQNNGLLNSGSSGYSASGSTVNGNLNNTNAGNRSIGQPIGSGSQTSSSFGSPTSGSNIHH